MFNSFFYTILFLTLTKCKYMKFSSMFYTFLMIIEPFLNKDFNQLMDINKLYGQLVFAFQISHILTNKLGISSYKSQINYYPYLTMSIKLFQFRFAMTNQIHYYYICNIMQIFTILSILPIIDVIKKYNNGMLYKCNVMNLICLLTVINNIIGVSNYDVNDCLLLILLI